MELVYLLVEDYKNIKKQGFNFSPRFRCEYDDVKNELAIEENKDYVSIFPDNINITAIVGENGSGKSSLLNLFELKLRNTNHFIFYKKEAQYYCEFNHVQPKIVFSKKIKYIDRNSHSEDNSFYPKMIRIAHNEKIGKHELSHFYFGLYSGIYGGWNIDRHNNYNMLEARFFVPRYINIVTQHAELFNKLSEMYKFDTLRLLLKDNSTSHVRKWIDKQINTFVSTTTLGSKKVCIYEKTEEVLKHIQKGLHYPIEDIEIHLYNRNREKIVSILETIESMHRQQTSTDQIKNYNKFQEFDLALLIAFTEYYLKNTDPCDPSNLVYETLIDLKEQIKNEALIDKHIIRITRSYILNFFQKLKDEDFKFIKDGLLTIDEIIESIKYIQKLNVIYFDSDGSPYIDITIDITLKEKLDHLKKLQKIFFDYEFDCGEEKYLRVFEYDLFNSKIGSLYDTISDGEKHLIRFGIDIIYYLQTLEKYNFTPKQEDLAIFLADEPDNAMHPTWKKKLINYVIEIFNTYNSATPNINKHFIFATHSPFLLSDISRENAIFLKRDEKGNCKNVTEEIKIETFGANIHTLLSHGFFMKDGLMGEFAKNKIDNIIKNLKGKEFNPSKEEKEKLLATIKIIGEEFLKTKLLDMYYKKFDDDFIKKQRKEELERLQEKISKELEQL